MNLEEKSVRLKVKCSHCGYATCNMKHMYSHILSKHFTVRKYRCPRGCKRSFLSKSVLRSHVQNAHDTKEELRCDQCDFTTFKAYAMKKHRSFSHSRNVWTCSGCAFSASTEDQLKEHERTSLCGMPRNCLCGVCGFRSVSESRIKSHMIRAHFANFKFDRKRKKAEQVEAVPQNAGS